MRVIGLVVGAVMVMLLVAVGFAHAGIEEAGTTAANFLSLGSGARVLGMGGAVLGLGDDLGSSAWNVAALGYVNRTEIVFSHSALGDGTMQEWAGIGGRLRGGSTRWSVDGLYQGNGSFEGRDASNLPTGNFNASSFAFGVHLARRFSDVLSLGAGTKVVSENLGTVSGFGATFDFGASAHAAGFGFGVAAQNLGGQMHYDGTPYRFPGNIGAGVSYALPMTGLRLAVDANFPQAYYNDVRVGAEYMWHDMVAIRAGYRHEMTTGADDPLSGPTFGVGAGWNGMWMDYGYLVSSTGEAQHRLGFRLFPGHGGSSDGGSTYGRVDQPSIAPPAPAPKRTTVSEKPATSKPASVAPANEPKSTPTITPTTSKSAPETTPGTTTSKPATTTKAEPKATKPAVTGTATTTAAGAATTVQKTVAPVSKPEAPKTSAPTKPVETSVKPVAKPVETPAKVTAAPVAKPAEEKSDAKPADDAKATATKSDDSKPADDAKVSAAKAEEPKPAEAKPAKAAKEKPRPSKVKVGDKDTLYSIAKQWNVSVAALMMENDLTNEKIHSGQTLKLPAAGR